jgi:hypothetical protein
MEENVKVDAKQDLGTIKLEQKRLKDCEWVFQFDEDEPQVFAWTNEDMDDESPTITFTIDNTEGAYISFKDKKTGKLFKLFARELSEEGIQLREFQAKQNKDLENGSEDKETQS